MRIAFKRDKLFNRGNDCAFYCPKINLLYNIILCITYSQIIFYNSSKSVKCFIARYKNISIQPFTQIQEINTILMKDQILTMLFFQIYRLTKKKLLIMSAFHKFIIGYQLAVENSEFCRFVKTNILGAFVKTVSMFRWKSM